MKTLITLALSSFLFFSSCSSMKKCNKCGMKKEECKICKNGEMTKSDKTTEQ